MTVYCQLIDDVHGIVGVIRNAKTNEMIWDTGRQPCAEDADAELARHLRIVGYHVITESEARNDTTRLQAVQGVRSANAQEGAEA